MIIVWHTPSVSRVLPARKPVALLTVCGCGLGLDNVEVAFQHHRLHAWVGADDERAYGTRWSCSSLKTGHPRSQHNKLLAGLKELLFGDVAGHADYEVNLHPPGEVTSHSH